jgi:hypothetical protein
MRLGPNALSKWPSHKPKPAVGAKCAHWPACAGVLAAIAWDCGPMPPLRWSTILRAVAARKYHRLQR